MSISAGHKQIRAFLFGDADHLRSARSSLLKYQFLGAAIDPVPCQMTRVRSSRCRSAVFSSSPLQASTIVTRVAACKIRKRVVHGPTCLARVLPTDHDVLRSQRTHCIGHDEKSDDPSSELLRRHRAPCKRLLRCRSLSNNDKIPHCAPRVLHTPQSAGRVMNAIPIVCGSPSAMLLNHLPLSASFAFIKSISMDVGPSSSIPYCRDWRRQGERR